LVVEEAKVDQVARPSSSLAALTGGGADEAGLDRRCLAALSRPSRNAHPAGQGLEAGPDVEAVSRSHVLGERAEERLDAFGWDLAHLHRLLHCLDAVHVLSFSPCGESG
jgi:hypothetical protein